MVIFFLLLPGELSHHLPFSSGMVEWEGHAFYRMTPQKLALKSSILDCSWEGTKTSVLGSGVPKTQAIAGTQGECAERFEGAAVPPSLSP